jgi:hypothetical protein
MTGDVSHELKVPDDMCGNLTIMRYLNDQPLEDPAMGEHPLIRSRRIINKDIEARITPAPNQSVDSFIEDMHIKVMQELESSDYVSTLRDPQEEQ